jgi:hypothetical protein
MELIGPAGPKGERDVHIRIPHAGRFMSHMEMMNGAGGHHMGMVPEKEGAGHCKMDHSTQAGQSGASPKQ